MPSPIINATPEAATVMDALGNNVSIELHFTPRKRLLTQDTCRRLLATGMMRHYACGATTDRDMIRAVLARIRRLAHQPVVEGGSDG
jgi:hypothetical protein